MVRTERLIVCTSTINNELFIYLLDFFPSFCRLDTQNENKNKNKNKNKKLKEEISGEWVLQLTWLDIRLLVLKPVQESWSKAHKCNKLSIVFLSNRPKCTWFGFEQVEKTCANARTFTNHVYFFFRTVYNRWQQNVIYNISKEYIIKSMFSFLNRLS